MLIPRFKTASIPTASPAHSPMVRLDRRGFLWQFGGGLGGIALASLLGQDGWIAGAESTGLSSRTERRISDGLHHPARAKRVVQLFMSGAASQVDTFDYKPELIRRHGERFDPGGKIELFQSNPGKVMRSPWKFRPRGECGRFVSDLLPELGGCVDDLCFLHAMTSKSNVHGPATFLQATGFVNPGFPAAGAWISLALGSDNQDLPTFVVLPDQRGFAPNGPANWSSGFLPAAHQGVMIRPSAARPILDLHPPEEAGLDPATDRAGLDLLDTLNRAHQSQRPGDSRLDARIASYELAARLQLAAPEALDVTNESPATRRAYGLDDETTADFGRNCLIARRLLERGVRFVQVWNGADNGFPRRNWDSHEDLARDHAIMGRSLDQPAAALIRDLKARGLLDETIVVWCTEFGRMPCSQGTLGRDHNPHGFTVFVAGGGFKGGIAYGQTDEWSYRAVEHPTTIHDLHATILHLLGIDHTRLTVRHNGINRRLTDVHGEVLFSLLNSEPQKAVVDGSRDQG
ncbi:protein of unknown function DUF1501 [Isosphaera pallida ATCC 43644]|uniref:Sulfatase n=1 Tax=Isosphaera pallida (strain ATCC 43644 / DSM 9630 / IS1B) TaxID=575540 RepID=E8R3V1_ISOPI|nr:DUF1501 domain-containing protein [Isosphaera pallida]ADV63681.1 protein of unknown function DUF1501 [Isosphaera pallida ATCC 43644]